MKKELKPIDTDDAWATPMVQKLSKAFEDIIYKDLIKELDKGLLENAKESELISKIKTGEISYYKGQFRGKFNSRVSKELRELGAVYDSRSKTFMLPLKKAPARIRSVVVKAQDKAKQIFDKLIESIGGIPDKTDDYLKTLDLYAEAKKVEGGFDKEFRQTVTKQIGIQPKITDNMRSKITEGYTDNYKLSIKKFADDEVTRLRDIVEENAMEGLRPSELIDTIFARQKISRERAKFVAKQETSLYVSKLRETKYREAGVKSYRWASTPDNRTRQLHKDLNNKVFSWDKPPVIDERTGERGHPGTAFGCRCRAIAIAEF